MYKRIMACVPVIITLSLFSIAYGQRPQRKLVPEDNFRILDERAWQQKIINQENKNNPAAIILNKEGDLLLDENGDPVIITASDEASLLDAIKAHPLTTLGTSVVLFDSVLTTTRAISMYRAGAPFWQAMAVMGGQTTTVTVLKGLKDLSMLPIDAMRARLSTPSYIPAPNTVKNAIITTSRVIPSSSVSPVAVVSKGTALTGIKGIAGGTVVTAGGMVVCHYTEKYCDLWMMELDQRQLNDLGDQLLNLRNKLIKCRDILENPAASDTVRQLVCPVGYSSLKDVDRAIVGYNDRLAIVNAKEKILLDAQVPRRKPTTVHLKGGRTYQYYK